MRVELAAYDSRRRQGGFDDPQNCESMVFKIWVSSFLEDLLSISFDRD
jgi:hypothetical protein